MGTHPIFESDFDCLTVDMGAGQSKTEVIFDRYPADNEVVKDIKLTPAMINELTATSHPQQPQVDIESIKETLRPEIESQLRPAIEGELREVIDQNVRAELEAEYYEKLSQISELREQDKAEIKAEYEAKLASVEQEVQTVQQSVEEGNTELESQNRVLAEQLEQTIKEANQAAQDHIQQSEAALTAQRRELVELQQRENERLLETTTPIFQSRKIEHQICPDIEQQLTQCYSENKERSLLCAEIVRNYTSCLEQEKQNYFKANLST